MDNESELTRAKKNIEHVLKKLEQIELDCYK